MKILLLFLTFFLSTQAVAGLDEFTISTKDKSCSIHYLTTKTKYNWTINVNEKDCKDGWVDGFAEVKIYSPTRQLTETISGFFVQGYWLETSQVIDEVIERTSPKKGIQSLSFLLGRDEEANITYIGQLRATQPENRSYGPFQGCPDFKVLVVPPDEKAFENAAFQDRIVKQGLKYAYLFCQEPETLSLFGAKETKSPHIIFKMQVDCATKERSIFPVEEEKTDFSEAPNQIKKEKTDILVRVEPDQESPKVLYVPQKENSSKPEKEKKEKSALKDLQILSKTLQSKVTGRTIVHIKKVLLDGSGITDLPNEIVLLYYPNLKPGWAIVEGTLNNNKMTISNIQFCQKEWCSDVS